MMSNQPSAESSPFLRLPLELRRLIYNYLPPNLMIYPHGRRKRLALRGDGKSGSGMLRVNRQIHNELFGDFYGNATFNMQVYLYEAPGILFLNYSLLHGQAMPLIFEATLEAVKTLHLKISFSRQTSETPETISSLSKALSSGKSSLKRLYLTLRVGTLNHMYAKNVQNQHTELLKLNLDPLRCIKGLSEASIVAIHPNSHPSGHMDFVVDEFSAKAREYLDVLEAEMMKPILVNEVPVPGL